ncbi:MAG: HNH endonuclease, partial [Myxococcales bacterium]|nr:HNH endonuclease [Myxococcales bacterium]
AHHITDRNAMPNGGYVAENGIALCPACHEKAERFHATGHALAGFHPDDLYRIVGSSREKAERASRRLG